MLNQLITYYIALGIYKQSYCLVTKLCLTLPTPWTVARQAPLSDGFPRQEYWSGIFFLEGIFPIQGLNPCRLH